MRVADAGRDVQRRRDVPDRVYAFYNQVPGVEQVTRVRQDEGYDQRDE